MSAETMTTQAAPLPCVRCGRVVTKREQHEELEGRVLDAIRAGRPEWAGAADVDGAPHVERYRALLRLRKRRGARARALRLRARIRRRRQIKLALRVLFAIVAVAAVALVGPVDLSSYFGRVGTGGGEKR